MKIVPAVLSDDIAAFSAMVRRAETFAPYLQFDLMDGRFTATKSFPCAEVSSVGTKAAFEVHLMVKDPRACLAAMKNPSLKRFIFHFESDEKQPRELIARIKERGLEAGIAVSPDTVIEQFAETAEHADSILFLTVNPGKYGSPFNPGVLEKVAGSRELFPEKEIGIDGGVSLENLQAIYETGADYACVGSRIFLAPDPAASYAEFTGRVKELEKSKYKEGGKP